LAGQEEKREAWLTPHMLRGGSESRVPRAGSEFSAGRANSDETLVEAVRGTDELCRVCRPHYRDERCEHPQGEEEALRKWGSILLKGLEISYSERVASKEWRFLIREKALLDFCQTRYPSKSG